MSRSSTAGPARSLSLTEELEKLEQSITLTLQEIDHNFSRAHRIVTTSILPIVEQYAEHSKAVWDGSKFWKQFFEASANVSLSGYEELASEHASDGEEESSALSHSETYGASPSNAYEESASDSPASVRQPTSTFTDTNSLLSSPSLTESTPRAGNDSKTAPKAPSFADYPSPYEALKREVAKASPSSRPQQPAPTTPGQASSQRLPDMSMTPQSSPFAPFPQLASTARGKDPLLHRVLDKNYRLNATPHTLTKSDDKHQWRGSDSPTSSPDVQAPKLHAEIFSSPISQAPGKGAPRTPGVSVQTPRAKVGRRSGWESSDSEDDQDQGYPEGMSPPKTMQFALPRAAVMKTPAREASKRIVEDLLLTAGANDTEDFDDSPEIIGGRRTDHGVGLLEEETF
ncbi:MAG: DASH complex subunit ask1 [Vezdaea acicularis]|nr:MAG: DASH complex subunit ask1 [Vezdaea acicularis]